MEEREKIEGEKEERRGREMINKYVIKFAIFFLQSRQFELVISNCQTVTKQRRARKERESEKEEEREGERD